MNKDQKQLQHAFALHQQGKLSEAANIYEQLITRNANNYDAIHFLGTIKASLGQTHEALKLIERSVVGTRHTNIPYIENYVSILFHSGNFQKAAHTCAMAIKENKRTETLQYVLAVSLYKLGRLKEAINEFDALLLANQNHLAATNEKASALAELGQYDAALSFVEKALKIDPRYAEAFLNKGNIFAKLKRFEESIAAYEQALSIDNTLAEAYQGYANALRERKRYDQALAACDKALAINPNLAEAWNGRGNVFTELEQYDKAIAAYDKALALDSNLAEAWSGRGNVLVALDRYDDASAAYDKALAYKPDLAEAWFGSGNVFSRLRRYDEAFNAYDKAFERDPDLASAESARLHAKMNLCDWRHFYDEADHLIASVNGLRSNLPFVLFSIPSSRRDQLKCAKLWNSTTSPAYEKPIWQGERYDHKRIRVAYISADFRDHAVAYLLTGVLEQHDRARFETIAISLGPDNPSGIRARLTNAFDRFMDVGRQSDADIARLLRTLEIDIAVDLMGYTARSRTKILAHRPAPIQINYLGYAGTMGAGYIDYLIADPTLIPQSHQTDYAEKIVYLPTSYMPNDDSGRLISDAILDRAEFGLPQSGFVFCGFNNAYKFNPRIFDAWMKILKTVDASVLWLSETNSTAVANLRKEAAARDVDPDRLIFAKRLSSSADHLARHRLADLFLDTLPYNAHTTASDALWAGLPVLTHIGETFAGRVAASLLNAIGLPELVMHTQEEYEKTAIELATSPEKLAAIRAKLAQNRPTAPAFNTQIYTRHLESAYEAIYERHRAGLPPDHIYVAQ